MKTITRSPASMWTLEWNMSGVFVNDDRLCIWRSGAEAFWEATLSPTLSNKRLTKKSVTSHGKQKPRHPRFQKNRQNVSVSSFFSQICSE